MNISNHTTAALILLSVCAPTLAAEVNLNGVVGNRALIAIDGGKPRWIVAGDATPEGVRLVSVQGQSAVIEIGGRRETLTLGMSARLGGASAAANGYQSVTLAADSRGHYLTTGMINGVGVRFLVDTGASMVSMSSIEAARLGINYAAGERAAVSTANGVVAAYKVKLDQVRVGDVTLTNVDGMVQAGANLPIVLLGMSFLNRMEMKREGETLVLTKRY